METYARETGNAIVKPFVLVIARDTTHAAQLLQLIQSDGFFEGRYKDKVIQVDSSKTGAEEEEMIERLLKVEHTDEPTEIVIHVNMLKEGWDVTNLYTIVPLRAANARTLIEQSIGRGLRLPYGKRTGVTAVDRLNIVAHDKFQEIVDEANKPDSAIRLQAVVLDPDQLAQKTVTVVSQSQLATKLGLQPEQIDGQHKRGRQRPAAVVHEAGRAEGGTDCLRGDTQAGEPAPRSADYRASARARDSGGHRQGSPGAVAACTLALGGVARSRTSRRVVAKTAELVAQQTIDIPRILVVPKGEVKSGFKPFTLKLDTLRYPAVSDELWIQHLRTDQLEVVALGRGGIEEARLEDYVVSGLVDFDDVSYDDHADLLYDLAAQTVSHFQSYLSEEDTRKVLRCYQRDIARFIHAQMQEHYWEEAVGYEVKISKGFTELKPSTYSAVAGERASRFPALARRQEQHGEISVRRVPALPLSGAEVRLRRRAQAGGHSWSAMRSSGSSPPRGNSRSSTGAARTISNISPTSSPKLQTRSTCWSRRPATSWMHADVQAKKEAAVRWCRQASSTRPATAASLGSTC